MPESDPASESQADSGSTRPGRLASAMRALWEAGDHAQTAALFAVASDVFDGRARQYLARDFSLDHDQVEDCIAESLEILLKKWHGAPTEVTEPYAYLWGTAKRRAVVMRRTQSNAVALALEEDHEPAALESSETWPESAIATVWFEELTDEVVAPEDRAWVTEVITLAVGRLPVALRQAAEFMLRPEFDHQETSAQDASSALNVTPAAYRQNKHRVLERLRKTIPGIVEELGIELSRRETESVFMDEPQLGLEG